MTVLQSIELRCPCCENTFDSQSVVSTNKFGGKRTDFHERAAGTQPLTYAIHACDRCGFAGDADDFNVPHADFSLVLQEKIWNELAPKVPPTKMTGWEKYEAAAIVAEWDEHLPAIVAHRWLCAAWCCVDGGREFREEERYYRIRAAWGYEIALRIPALDGGPSNEERATYTYLIGELWRRAGFIKRSARWFGRVPLEVVNAKEQKWVLDMAQQQRESPREWFG